MKKMRVVFLIFIGIALLFLFRFLFSDSGVLQNLLTRNNIQDGGFISGKPCSPPCFFGIIPNETHESQAIKLLRDQGLYKQCTYIDGEKESGLRGFDCHSTGVTYFRSSDLVGEVSFEPSEPISVETVLGKYGPPDSVSVSYSWFTWDNETYTSMSLNYDRFSGIVDLGDQKGDKFILSPKTLVTAVGYTAPDFPTAEESAQGKQFLSTWHGYGEYTDPNQ